MEISGEPFLVAKDITYFELRTHAWVTKVNLDSSRKRATSVSYTDVATGEEYEQPASLVILCALAIGNAHLMLLSGIGAPYDPTTGKGAVGKNYCYQVNGYDGRCDAIKTRYLKRPGLLV